MRPPKVLVAGHDWGGLNILAPLLRAWTGKGAKVDASFLGMPAVRREMSYRVSDLQIAPGADAVSDWTFERRDELTQAVDASLDAETYDLILCGTSAHAPLERLLLIAGRKRGIPTIAFCDMWWAYADRFRDGSSWALPDRLWVIDETMKVAVGRLDWPAPLPVDVVGSPLFGDLLARSGSQDDTRRVVRFISEPASTKFPEARIDEFALAEAVVRSVNKVLPSVPIVIRPHPTESVEAWRRWVFARRDRSVQFDTLPLEETYSDTAFAVGIASMLLAEMRMFGTRVASFQSSEANPDYYCLPFEELDIARVRTESELEDWFLSAPGDSRPAITALHAGAVRRATALALDAAVQRRR